MSLFSSSSAQGGGSGAGGASAPSDGSLLSFKAGRMHMNGNMVEADPRKGQVTLKRDDAGLLNFQWRDRSTGSADEPIILFPGDQKFLQCKSAPAEARVVYLHFPNRREFLWLQEPDASKDADLVRRFNEIVNGPPENAGGELGAEFGDINPHEQAALLQMLQAQNMGNVRLQGATATPGPGSAGTSRSGPAATPMATGTPQVPPAAPGRPAQPEASSQAPALDERMMQGVLQGLAQEARQRGHQGTALADILKPDNVEQLLSDPTVVERLLPHLPEGANRTASDVRTSIRSPQYSQALAMFSAALQSGDMDAAMGQLGVDASEASASGGGAEGLAAAIQRQEDARRPKDEEDSSSGPRSSDV